MLSGTPLPLPLAVSLEQTFWKELSMLTIFGFSPPTQVFVSNSLLHQSILLLSRLTATHMTNFSSQFSVLNLLDLWAVFIRRLLSPPQNNSFPWLRGHHIHLVFLPDSLTCLSQILLLIFALHLYANDSQIHFFLSDLFYQSRPVHPIIDLTSQLGCLIDILNWTR